MTNKMSSWIKSLSENQSDAYTTDEDRITGLDDSMGITLLDADAEVYKRKYQQLRKQVEDDEIYKDLQAKITFLQSYNGELEVKLIDLETSKLSVEVRLMRREKELKNVEAHNTTELGASNAQNETLKLENKMLKKNEEYVKFLLQSHGIQMPGLIGPLHSGPPTPELTDDSDTDEADEADEAEELDGAEKIEDPPTVCSEWYNHGKCSRGGGTGSNKCKHGMHPRLVYLNTLPRP